jgi:uncharacterized membrane protein
MVDLLDLIARWVHVIAGIMWIGNSLLFNWLDRILTPAHERRPDGAIGDTWLLHSGGFYFVEKTLLGTRALPSPLHWFKWQAYTTWLSGVALLLVVYYLGGRAVLADPTVAPLDHGQAVLVGAGAIVGGWALYEVVQRTLAPRRPVLAGAIWMAGLAAIAVALTQLLNGRAAFLHVGAMLGTIMAANVFVTIVPSQRELVASVREGRGASAAVSARAKRVSIHNNYFTFPVIVLMLSSHFPSVYGHRWNWLLLLLLIAIGATVRHVLNARVTLPTWRPALAGTLAAGAAALALVLRAGAAPDEPRIDGAGAAVTFAEARHVIDRRCAVCHSRHPADLTFGVAPGGVTFDTPAEVLARVDRIHERAVVTRTMPPANKTHITDDERAVLARWIANGAPPP